MESSEKKPKNWQKPIYFVLELLDSVLFYFNMLPERALRHFSIVYICLFLLLMLVPVNWLAYLIVFIVIVLKFIVRDWFLKTERLDFWAISFCFLPIVMELTLRGEWSLWKLIF